MRKKRCKAYRIQILDLVQIIISTEYKNPFTYKIFKAFYYYKSIASIHCLNTKALKISTAYQLRLTAERFGQVMLANGRSEVAGWCLGVSVDDFKMLHLNHSRSYNGVPQKKIADLSTCYHF